MITNIPNLPIISRTVSGLNGVQVPFESAVCSSFVLMCPLRSLSTLSQPNHIKKEILELIVRVVIMVLNCKNYKLISNQEKQLVAFHKFIEQHLLTYGLVFNTIFTEYMTVVVVATTPAAKVEVTGKNKMDCLYYPIK